MSADIDPMELLMEELALKENQPTSVTSKDMPKVKEKEVKFNEKKDRKEEMMQDKAKFKYDKIVAEEHAKEAKNVEKAAKAMGETAIKMAAATKQKELDDSPENRSLYQTQVMALRERFPFLKPIRQRFSTAQDYKSEVDSYKDQLALRRAEKAFSKLLPSAMETIEAVNKKFAMVLLPMGVNTFHPVSLKANFDQTIKKDPFMQDAIDECSILYGPWFKTSPTSYVLMGLGGLIYETSLKNSQSASAGPAVNENIDPTLYPDL